jgi:pyridinium-3,5-bisthiocarboxylic acid mononucleotide nickel chelatase
VVISFSQGLRSIISTTEKRKRCANYQSAMIRRMGLHLHLDPFSGIAGDMFLGAMIDLGVSLDDLRDALAPLPVALPYRLTADRVMRHGISSIDFKVHVTEPPVPPEGATQAHSHSHGGASGGEGGAHTHKPGRHGHYGEILAMIDRLETSDRARQRARKTLDALAHAEAQVHGVSIHDVHFHEVGAVDSIVDMLGSAVAMELLDIETVSCGPLPLSRGFVRCEHGKMPVPAPATAYLMRGMLTVGVDRAMELVTPTGAAIVAAITDTYGPSPAMTIQNVGYGAGDRDVQPPEAPNLLRAFIGTKQTAKQKAPLFTPAPPKAPILGPRLA